MGKYVWGKVEEYWKFIKIFWIVMLLIILIGASFFVIASKGGFGPMPTFERLENPETNLASEFISSDGITFGKLYLSDNRTPVSIEELPGHLIDALISTEDVRFYKHSGIDARGTFRALLFLGSRGGASTISQQLSRQLFVGVRSRNLKEAILQKFKEWVIAVQLERNYTKEEIIEMYLNNYDFNYNADGIRSASRIYFGKEPSALKIEEGAMLVGMLKNSSYYNPIRRTELVVDRRNTVLNQMEKYGYITQQRRDSLKAMPLELNFQPESHRQGLATYFRMYMQSWLSKWVKENFKSDGSPYNIYKDGLKVYTTIDSRLQENAEKAMVGHLKNLQKAFFRQNNKKTNPTAPFVELEQEVIDGIINRSMKNSERWRKLKQLGKPEDEIKASFYKPVEMKVFDYDSPRNEKDTLLSPMDSLLLYKSYLRSAMMSLNPKNGHVKSWVGGVDYKHFQYDNVFQGTRQVGSTFKPFVYTAAIDQLRMSPCDSLPDVQYCIAPMKHGNVEAWCPKNSGSKYSGGNRTLKNALANSINTVTAQLIDRVGPGSVASIAKEMGISSYIPKVPSIALGTPDINVMELVAAYGTFANEGVFTAPVVVTRIEDRNGVEIYNHVPQTKDVLSKEIAYTIVKLLEGVTEAGSGMRLRHDVAVENEVYQDVVTGYPYMFENPIAGKTGTTQNHSDGWFMGMVPNLVTGVWVGGEDRSVHFDNIAYGQGATMALPIWANYMKMNYENPEIGISMDEFVMPENFDMRVDCSVTELDDEEIELDDDDLDLESFE
ncbi:MAG: transglycosylase domain-containing protein [Flavobacteriaceae bacterium]